MTNAPTDTEEIAARAACEAWWSSFGGSAAPEGEWEGLDETERGYWRFIVQSLARVDTEGDGELRTRIAQALQEYEAAPDNPLPWDHSATPRQYWLGAADAVLGVFGDAERDLRTQRDSLGQKLGALLVALGVVNDVPLTGPQLLNAADDASAIATAIGVPGRVLVPHPQTVRNIYRTLGFDTDGQPTPAAVVGDLGALVEQAAAEAREDYNEALSVADLDTRELARLREAAETVVREWEFYGRAFGDHAHKSCSALRDVLASAVQSEHPKQ